MHMIEKNNSGRNPDCSLKCLLYLHQNRLKLRWFKLEEGTLYYNLFTNKNNVVFKRIRSYKIIWI
ncbi:hypothetical protein FC695_17855 [Bacillus cereus]|uniref:Uncharacterized protein n=1 Tax=Bacillus cereus TaxID=1396 RepID=A0A9X9A8I7_BACCE|nr:hypothetical protein FC692_19510 [Bacillus cereus]TKJ01931.1 hypothetical protein FC695_17855 [Bacillus cereus]